MQVGDLAPAGRNAVDDPAGEVLVDVLLGRAILGQGHGVQGDMAADLAMAELVQAAVGGDGQQPAPRRVSGWGGGDVAKSADEGVLSGVFGGMVLAEDTF